jgi:hypothetical protein
MFNQFESGLARNASCGTETAERKWLSPNGPLQRDPGGVGKQKQSERAEVPMKVFELAQPLFNKRLAADIGEKRLLWKTPD